MPFQSEKQRRYLWANEPEIARDWTDTYGSGIAKALGGRIGFFKGAQADTASGKSMSPGTSAGHTPGAGHRDSGGWSPGVGGTQHIPTHRPAPRPDPTPTPDRFPGGGIRAINPYINVNQNLSMQNQKRDWEDYLRNIGTKKK